MGDIHFSLIIFTHLIISTSQSILLYGSPSWMPSEGFISISSTLQIILLYGSPSWMPSKVLILHGILLYGSPSWIPCNHFISFFHFHLKYQILDTVRKQWIEKRWVSWYTFIIFFQIYLRNFVFKLMGTHEYWWKGLFLKSLYCMSEYPLQHSWNILS